MLTGVSSGPETSTREESNYSKKKIKERARDDEAGVSEEEGGVERF